MEAADARRALFSRLIDHAPMFPPASLAPADALAEDARAANNPHAFMLARLVWPASATVSTPPGRALSVVLDGPLPEGVRAAAVEARYREDLASLAGLADEVYVEVPLEDALEERLDRLATQGFRAKVRCGGGAVPRVDDLARFVRMCRDRKLMFKATAGLHHAVRTSGEHGLLNLLAAVVFAGDEEAALEEADASAFVLDATAFAWGGRAAAAAEIARIRGDLFHSIGSCSFVEPVEELAALGVLPP